MENQFVKLKMDERVAVITIDHPPVNILNPQVIQELNTVLDQCDKDSQVKAVVITGAGNLAFVAGADIKVIATLSKKEEGTKVALEGQAVLNKIEKLKVPVIAAINAICVGGGNELALACHMRVASDRAKFGQPEISLGIIPGFGGTQRLTRLCGIAKSRELCLTGDLITAQEALRIGLVNRVVPDGEVLKQAIGLAKKVTSKGKRAIEKVQQAITEGFEQPLEKALQIEAKYFGEICETNDMKEGVRAFLEKRQPKFTDS